MFSFIRHPHYVKLGLEWGPIEGLVAIALPLLVRVLEQRSKL